MADREKVVRAIEKGVANAREGLGLEAVHMTTEFCEKSLLPLLREQEAVWLYKTDPLDEVYLLWECSRCGHKSPDEGRYRYCPHCGARMDVEKE